MTSFTIVHMHGLTGTLSHCAMLHGLGYTLGYENTQHCACAITALFLSVYYFSLYILQIYEVLILFAVYFLYVYARPYKATFVNILELALLAYLGLFLILAKDFQQQAATSTQLDATSVDKIACIYLYAYIILYVGNMCVGHAVC